MSAHGPEIDLIEHDKNGLMFGAGSSRELAEAMEKLITNPDLHRRLSTAARERVMTENTLEHMLSGYLEALSAPL